MINELENRERCETRKFDGIIQNPNERFMPCAFCGRRGDHYSDSCLVYRFTGERKERVNRAHLCTMCLDYDCPGGRRCLKRNTRCYHCGRSGHNSALCTLPEKSVRINDELELLQRRYNDALIRVLRLERKLRRRGVDIKHVVAGNIAAIRELQDLGKTMKKYITLTSSSMRKSAIVLPTTVLLAIATLRLIQMRLSARSLAVEIPGAGGIKNTRVRIKLPAKGLLHLTIRIAMP
ncbi:hypothetical protein OSTOST_08530 [Ostertagia ostertagi]